MFSFTDLNDFAKWLDKQAIEATAKMNGLARTKSDKAFYKGVAHGIRDIETMIRKGQIEIGGVKKEGEDAQSVSP